MTEGKDSREIPYSLIPRADILADNARLALTYRGTWQRRPESMKYAAVSAVGFNAGRLGEVRRQYSDRPVGIARFSLPGYSAEGYAMVLASYGCGEVCGISLLILLNNDAGIWHIAKT